MIFPRICTEIKGILFDCRKRFGTLLRGFLIFIAAVLFVSGGTPLNSADEVTLFYHCADSQIDNYALLKSAFDQFLLTRAKARFQPVRRWQDFESIMQNGPNAYYIMSGAAFTHIASHYDLHPLFYGEWGGNLFEYFDLYFPALVSETAPPAQLVVATAFTPSVATRLIDEILADAGQTNSPPIHLLHVPKHLDALIAMRLSQADAALVARDIASLVGTVNPNSRLSGRPYHRLVVAQRGNSFAHGSEVDLLRRMHEFEDGQKVLKLLRLVRLRTASAEGDQP